MASADKIMRQKNFGWIPYYTMVFVDEKGRTIIAGNAKFLDWKISDASDPLISVLVEFDFYPMPKSRLWKRILSFVRRITCRLIRRKDSG